MFEVGRSKRAQQAFAFDDVTIVPSRRTRGDEEVSLQWRIDAYTFEFPLVAAPMDSVMSPATAIRVGQLGGLGVLNLEGLWTRYEDPEQMLDEIIAVGDPVAATRRMQEIYAEPIKPELIGARIAEIRGAGVPAAGALSPQNTQAYAQAVVDSGVDFFVIRGTTVSAEHVSSELAPLNLKQFIYDLDVPVIVGGCATYQAALHLMRTGAAGVLVGFGGGAARPPSPCSGSPYRWRPPSPMSPRPAATTWTSPAAAMCTSSPTDRSAGPATSPRRSPAGPTRSWSGRRWPRPPRRPGGGFHWGPEAWHANLPRGERAHFDIVGTLEQILLGPSTVPDGTMNLVGALRKSMSTTGYTELKEFQRVEIIVG